MTCRPEGRAGDGIYFIWDGEAEVCGPGNPEERSRSEYQLKRYDYFGHGGTNVNLVEQPSVIALSKLTCLVLAKEHCHMLRPKSIWNADGTGSLVENILHLESVEVDLFKGITLPDAPKFGKVFGGQLVGQALAAASKSVDFFKLVHSLHTYFLLVGDFDIPILYRVHRLRDGRSFATRKVEAVQKGNVIFILLASFQKEETGFEHQQVTMPSVPEPESLLSMEQLRERRLTDPRLPRTYRNKVATSNFVPWPIEIRFCEPNNNTNQTKAPARSVLSSHAELLSPDFAQQKPGL
uniref:Cyclic nucleotide-binding domain-containing protein n=1 Tax=Kalanchoe fedtschenkoi TaxID=63787 RepID=A0A7N0V8Z9_KALFE